MDAWDKMLADYCELMGWDRKTGVPLPETLERLGISEAADARTVDMDGN